MLATNGIRKLYLYFLKQKTMRNFYQLLINNVIGALANMTVWFALTFFAYLQTNSVIATSVMSGVYLITVAFTSIWFGGLVDKYNKKLIMIISSCISLVIFILGFIIYVLAPAESFKNINNPIFWVFIILILFGVLAGNLRGIAIPTIVPMLVPKDKLDKANGLVGTSSGIAFLVVSVISGFLVSINGMFWALLIPIIITLGTILHLQFLKLPEPVKEQNNNSEPEANSTDANLKSLDIKGTIKIIKQTPGLFPLIFFTTFNNFLGGVFMSLMDAYGLSLVDVRVWGLLWGFLSLAFMVGGTLIATRGLGKNPVKTLFLANSVIWFVSAIFTLQPSIILFAIGAFVYLTIVPFIEASEHTIIQKVVPQDRLGRVFGFSQSIEQAASPLMAFAIGPITQLIFIPFMRDGGNGANLIGSWFGTGDGRGIALVFTIAGVIGLIATLIAWRGKYYKLLSNRYAELSANS